MTPEYLKISKRALGIDMQMKIRTPHQNQTHWKRTHHLPEFLFFPQGQSVFQKGKRKESLKKKKKKKPFSSNHSSNLGRTTFTASVKFVKK